MTDVHRHLQLRLEMEKAERIAREVDIHLHNTAVQFVRGDKTRKDLRKALDAADAADATAKRADKEYRKSWNALADGTVSV